MFYGRENVLILMIINGNATCLTCRSMKVLSAFCDSEFHHWALMEGQSERDSSISLPISFSFRCRSYSLLCKRVKVTFLALCVRILTFQMYLKSINLTLESLLQKPRLKKGWNAPFILENWHWSTRFKIRCLHKFCLCVILPPIMVICYN